MIRFYLQYAARNIWRNRRWSAFAMLAVAAGVAAVVALRSLGLAIGDSLNSNVRAVNHGDISLVRGSAAPLRLNLGDSSSADVFTDFQIESLRDWTANRDGRISTYTFASLQMTAADVERAGLFNFVTALFVEPATYPPTDDIFTLEPDGARLGDLLQTPADVVISENLALGQNLAIGDAVRVSGSTNVYTVRGIVPTETEAGLADPFAAFFGFVYFDLSQLAPLGLNPRPNRVSIALPEGTPLPEIEQAANELHSIMRRTGPNYRILSVPSLIERNEFIADLTGRFAVVMGLGAMLIGGVGIINTMLVMVRRRTEEIAALKTFGLKGRQVALLFMVEALMLGFLGSVVGAVVGALLSRITNAYGETFVQQPLTWRIYPESLVFGIVLGVVVTGVFGVMPVLTAVRVRPGIILRPNEPYLPALGVLQSIGVTLFVVLALGLIAGQIIGPFPTPFDWPVPPNMVVGVVGVAVTMLLLALLAGLFWVLVWFVGKFPHFGWVDLRLALTNLRAKRLRTATTLLAISVGMFALSSITFYGAAVREILQFNLIESFGGNLVVISPATFGGVERLVEGAQRNLDAALDELEGVVYRTRIMTYDGTVMQVNDRSFRSEDIGLTREQVEREIERALRQGDLERVNELNAEINPFLDRWVNLSVRSTDNPNITAGSLEAGRHLTLLDSGTRVAVVENTESMRNLGITLGSTVTFDVRGRELAFEVVGIRAEATGADGTFGEVEVPTGTLDALFTPNFQLNTILVEEDQMTEVQLALSAMPGFFPVNVSLLDGIVSRFIEQFSALPLLVGLLSLAAAAVIMANTVALATLERRKQIGILKAVGLKSRRVLGIMLLENTLISLLGGLLGIGLSALGVLALTYFGLEELVLIPEDARPVAVILVIAAVIIGSAATFLSANVAVRERVLNVLRYE
ncbi:MAG: hypothetical protein OHK0046_13650 [Anaerolineae bacterium]